MHQRLRCAGHGNVDLICPVGRRFGKVSRRGIGGEWGVAAMLRRRAWRQGLSALPYARSTEPSSTGGKWPTRDFDAVPGFQAEHVIQGVHMNGRAGRTVTAGAISRVAGACGKACAIADRFSAKSLFSVTLPLSPNKKLPT